MLSMFYVSVFYLLIIYNTVIYECIVFPMSKKLVKQYETRNQVNFAQMLWYSVYICDVGTTLK